MHLHEANAGSRNPGSIKKSPFLPLGIRGAGNSSRNQPFPAPEYRQVGRRLRLAELGFVVDSEVTVVNEIAGNLIVQVKESRLALDRTMANRIMIG